LYLSDGVSEPGDIPNDIDERDELHPASAVGVDAAINAPEPGAVIELISCDDSIERTPEQVE
jgi:hypothetical protein